MPGHPAPEPAPEPKRVPEPEPPQGGSKWWSVLQPLSDRQSFPGEEEQLVSIFPARLPGAQGAKELTDEIVSRMRTDHATRASKEVVNNIEELLEKPGATLRQLLDLMTGLLERQA